MDLRQQITEWGSIVLELETARARIAELEAENRKLRGERDPWKYFEGFGKRENERD